MMKKIFLRDAVSGAEGEGAEVNRLFPVRDFMNFDPFVLWDDFTVPPTAGFPDHPHRGFEGVTYVFEGTMLHKDNLGNESTVTPGGLQRFTAGKGIIHSEMPSTKKTTKGIQMWVNLPRRLKQVDPEYQQVDADSVPEQTIEGGSIRELAGEDSPLKLKTPVRYLDVQLSAGAHFEETLPPDFRGFVYMIKGSVVANDKILSEGSALFYDENAKLSIDADGHSRFMVCFGQPHGEPIYQRGPYVD
jgi:redox-sensitive bicupin YhaK (pirin superfamily)